jgi:uncharacterized protein involved in outer membrane biogenesis
MRMPSNTNLLTSSRLRLSLIFRNRWFRWSTGFFLLYGIISALLVPVLLRQLVLPTLEHQTGIALNIKGIHWNPYALELGIDGLSFGTTPDDPLLGADRLSINLGVMGSLYQRAWTLDGITLVNPSLDIHTTPSEQTNLDLVLDGIKERTPDEPQTSDQSALRLFISHIHLAGGQFRFSSQQDQRPVTVRSIELSLLNVKTWGNDESVIRLSFQTDDQAQLKAEGSFLPDGSGCHIMMSGQGIHLSQFQSLIPQTFDPPQIEGDLEFSGLFTLQEGGTSHFQLDQVHADLRHLKVTRPQFELPMVALESLVIDQGSVNLLNHRVDLGTLELDDFGLLNQKGSDGRPAWMALGPKTDVSKEIDQGITDAKNNANPWKVSIHQLKLADIHLLPRPPQESAHAPDVRIGGLLGNELDIDTASQTFIANQLRLSDTSVFLGVGHDAIQPFDAMENQAASSEAISQINDKTPSPWAIRLNHTEISDLSLGFIHLDDIKPESFELTKIQLDLGAIDTQGTNNTPLEFTSDVSSGGRVEIKGNLHLTEQRLETLVHLDHVGLKPLRSLLSDSYRFDSIEGFLSTQLKMRGHFEPGLANADFEGQMQIDGLRLTQPPGERKLLAWRSLFIEGIKGALHPFRFSANEIRVIEPDGVIAIREDKGSNLSDLEVPSHPSSNDKARSISPSKQNDPDPDIHIRRIRIEGGKLDYSDQSLVLPFTTQIVDLKGAIRGWTLDPTGKSLLELNGRIAPYGEAAIHGQLRPRDPKSSLDIDLHFENVVLSALTPYSATFAGRKIQNGKLDFNAHYQLEDQQLVSDNRIYLKQLRLGDKVESPKAVSLPLDLAVALLSDTEGNIDLSLPIEGRTDAPDFDYGTIVLNAFGNLIKKAVLSPFTAMSSALGFQGGDDLDAIAFDLGSDVLTPPEREKVRRLGEALKLKPQIQLTLNGVFEPQQDLRVLRQYWLRKEVASRLGETLKPGEEPDPVNPTEASTQRILESLSKEFDVLTSATTRYVAEHGQSPDRVGIVGPMFGKGSKTPAFYEQLMEELVEHAPIDQAEIKQLAERRMKVVKETLMAARTSLDASRIRMGEIQEQSSEDGHHLKMPLTLQLN